MIRSAAALALAAGVALAAAPPPAEADQKTPREKKIDRHIYLAEYYVVRERDLDAAVKEYRRALRLDRGHRKAGLGLAHAYLEKGEPERAVRVLERLARRSDEGKKSPELWQALGKARLEAGDGDAALAAWREAIEIQPRDAESHWLVFFHLNGRYRSGEKDLADELQGAAEAYVKVARYRKGPNFRLAKRTLIELKDDQAALALYDGRRAYRAAFEKARVGTINAKMAEARRRFEACLKAAPQNQACHYWLGKVHASVKASDHYDLSEAREHFRKARKMPEAHVALGDLHRRADQLDRAARAYRRALDLDADHQAALVGLAVVYKLQGEEGAAVTLLVQAYRADRRSSDAAEALDELAKIEPKHRLLRSGVHFGNAAGDVFDTDRFAAAVDMVERRLGGVDQSAPEQQALEEILGRLMDAADISSEHDVKVAVLRTRMPNAMALPNGNIYFTRGMLDFIEKKFPKRELDADNDILGFVLAHELSHVIREHTLETGLYQQAIKDASRRVDPAVLTHVTRLQEIEADRSGLILTFLAGYHPRGGIELMEVQGQEHEIPAHLNHPTFEERVHYLEEYWSNDVKYAFLSFRQGVGEMRQGRRFEGLDLRRAVRHYREAVEHFRRYQKTLEPTKRVLNNLGVAYTKIGLYELTRRGSPMHRWYTPMSIERNAALEYVSLRREASSRTRTRGAPEEPRPPKELRRAVKLLGEALKRDPDYSRGRANLAAAYLALEEPKKALGALDSATSGRGASAPKLLVLRGVAYAELGEHGTAARAFKRAKRYRVARRAVAYNMARLYQVAGREEDARAAYRSFLERWPKGTWAKAARKALEDL